MAVSGSNAALRRALVRADALARKERYRDAIKHCKDALMIEPRSLAAHILMAESFFGLGQMKRAIGWYAKIDINQCNIDDATMLCTHRAIAYADLDDERSALKWIDKCLEIDPRQDKVWILKGTILAGKKKNNSKKLPRARMEKALHCFDMAVSIDPKLADVMYHKGMILAEYGDVHGAISSFDGAIRAEPMFLAAYAAKGEMLESIPDYKGAMRCYTSAQRRSPKNTNFMAKKAYCMYKLGRHRDSINLLKKALKMDPGMPHARRLIRSMEDESHVQRYGYRARD